LSKYSNDRPKTGLRVEVRNGDFAGALRKFKKKIALEGVLIEYKEKQHYEKPSLKRKKAKAAGRARHLKAMRERNKELGF
jgi:small subunit ribosomal protein S21